MLLTEKEIKTTIDGIDLSNGNFADAFRLCYEGVAKAQLKKDAEYIKNLPTDGHDKWYWYHQDLAESLLKEVKDD